MPELPEVETLRGQLAAVLKSSRMTRGVVLDPKLKGISFGSGSRVRSVERHGKWLRIFFDDGSEYRFHLRMTGRLLLWEGKTLPGHARLLVEFAKGRRTIRLCLVDPRRFATVQIFGLLNGPGRILPGQDAFSPLSAEKLSRAASRRKVSIKTFLLDQKTISGIGNIYACEVLYAAGIHPDRLASQMTGLEWTRLARRLPGILETAIACRGTSVSDWRDLYGQKGEFQDRLTVYKREGSRCPRCGGRISRMNQGGRSTFYCPGCQK